MIEKIQVLSGQIANLDGANVELTVFPSGAAMLHVVRSKRLFVLNFSPTRRFGVDEVHEDDGFLISYRFTSDDFEPAAAELRDIVNAANPPMLIKNGTLSSDLKLLARSTPVEIK